MKWVDTNKGLEAAIADASASSIVAIDTEADSLHSYFEKVCLIQLSTEREDWVIDPLAVDPLPLGEIMTEATITKVFHGADFDLRIMNRDFGFEVRNLIDTMVCAQLCGETSIGLAALLQKFFGIGLDKSHQRADWSRRPLSDAMLEYAATDTRHLVGLAGVLRAELDRRGRWEWAIEEFGRLESVRHTPPADDGERYRRVKGAGRLDRRGLEVISRLHGWRDGLAKRRDVPPFKVIGNDVLVEIAQRKPMNDEDLAAIDVLPRPLLKRYQRDLLRAVRQAMVVAEDDLPEKITGKPWVKDREIERRVEKLKKVRDRIAVELGIEPSVLAPKHLLTAVVEAGVRSLEGLDEVPAFRDWQKKVIGPALVGELAGTGPGR